MHLRRFFCIKRSNMSLLEKVRSRTTLFHHGFNKYMYVFPHKQQANIKSFITLALNNIITVPESSTFSELQFMQSKVLRIPTIQKSNYTRHKPYRLSLRILLSGYIKYQRLASYIHKVEQSRSLYLNNVFANAKSHYIQVPVQPSAFR